MLPPPASLTASRQQQKENLIYKYLRNELPVQKWRVQQQERQDIKETEKTIPTPIPHDPHLPCQQNILPTAADLMKQQKKNFQREKRRKQWQKKQDEKNEVEKENPGLHALLNLERIKRSRPYVWDVDQELTHVYQKKRKEWFGCLFFCDFIAFYFILHFF
jgi:hypothetical protein